MSSRTVLLFVLADCITPCTLCPCGLLYSLSCTLRTVVLLVLHLADCCPLCPCPRGLLSSLSLSSRTVVLLVLFLADCCTPCPVPRGLYYSVPFVLADCITLFPLSSRTLLSSLSSRTLLSSLSSRTEYNIILFVPRGSCSTEPAACRGGAVTSALSRARRYNDGKQGKGGNMEYNIVLGGGGRWYPVVVMP